MRRDWTKPGWRMWTLAALALLTLAFSASAERNRTDPAPRVDSGIPPILNSTIHPTGPTFVSADLAFDPQGLPDPSVLGEVGATGLRHHLDNFRRGALERTDCVPWGPVWIERVTDVDRSSLQASARSSEMVLLGKVVGRDYGFYKGRIPGQLLKVQATEVLRGPRSRDFCYVFYPVATFEAGPYTFCKTDSRYPAPPDPGDDVALLVYRIYDADEPVLDLRDEQSIVVLDSAGEARLSKGFSDTEEGGLTRREVVTRLRDAVGGP